MGAGAVPRIDAYQQRHRWFGLPLAVVYKFFDDQAPYLAALLTYYGFLSLFPLLLLLVSVLGVVLHGNPQLQQQVVDSVLTEFPVLGDQLQNNIRAFRGSGAALAVGVLGSLYGALGVAQAAQYTLNKLWAVPRHARLDPLRSRFRGLLFLMMVAAGLLMTTLLSSSVAAGVFGADFGPGVRASVSVVAVAVNALLLLVTYRFLTHRQVSLRFLWAESLLAACAWQGLQRAGGYYVSHVLHGASSTYGMFGLVLGFLGWIYLGALVFVLAAEVGAVRAHQLWPRSLLTPFTDRVRLSRGDQRAYTSYATTETFKGFEKVSVDFRQRLRPPEGPERDPPPEDPSSEDPPPEGEPPRG